MRAGDNRKTMLSSTPILFLDFDGTVSRRDAVDLILETFADERWLAIEEHWREGRIGSRDCLRAQMSLVRASSEQLNALIESIELDDGLQSLLETCHRHHITTHIISDGFDYCIRRILSRGAAKNLALSDLLREVRVCASHLETAGSETWHTDFPYFPRTCSHGCATCKPALMRLLNRAGAMTVFVGDGLSDRYAVAEADIVFAKKSLARYCDEQGIEYHAYDSLADVGARLIHAVQNFAEPRQEKAERMRA
jgi:2-hydroxy-3-keto-5-methylthiopentenyl-1-phosphate phosphatase